MSVTCRWHSHLCISTDSTLSCRYINKWMSRYVQFSFSFHGLSVCLHLSRVFVLIPATRLSPWLPWLLVHSVQLCSPHYPQYLSLCFTSQLSGLILIMCVHPAAWLCWTCLDDSIKLWVGTLFVFVFICLSTHPLQLAILFTHLKCFLNV